MAVETQAQADAILAQIKRPDRRLLIKYLIPFVLFFLFIIIGAIAYAIFQPLIASSQATQIQNSIGMGGFVVLFWLLWPIVLLIRYYTLSYEVDDRGIRMSEGLINRKENFLTFARVQDIHLDRDLIDRWLGIGTISVQTASGQATAEAKLYGLANSLEARDALYLRLRKVQGLVEGEADEEDKASAPEAASAAATAGDAGLAAEELTALLRGLAEETARLRTAMEALSASRLKPAEAIASRSQESAPALSAPESSESSSKTQEGGESQ
jgi:uncharacterized membrane protein YdbT with pleckstrin-like domain